MGFQKSVLSIAVIVLIIALIVMALVLRFAKDNSKFPPEIASCPDYFIPQGLNVCGNPKHLGNGIGDTVTFTGNQACAESGCTSRNYAARCQWAKGSGVQWDGITNQNIC